ncbi:hypothetical protein MHBO_000206 [Bonamia ostreae]|uniref:Uncharacterized protein n=1 Tax=Bonamia ostreae TaxID=126728 RepID=A0ABV2AG34_9EUKA
MTILSESENIAEHSPKKLGSLPDELKRPNEQRSPFEDITVTLFEADRQTPLDFPVALDFEPSNTSYEIELAEVPSEAKFVTFVSKLSEPVPVSHSVNNGSESEVISWDAEPYSFCQAPFELPLHFSAQTENGHTLSVKLEHSAQNEADENAGEENGLAASLEENGRPPDEAFLLGAKKPAIQSLELYLYKNRLDPLRPDSLIREFSAERKVYDVRLSEDDAAANFISLRSEAGKGCEVEFKDSDGHGGVAWKETPQVFNGQFELKQLSADKSKIRSFTVTSSPENGPEDRYTLNLHFASDQNELVDAKAAPPNIGATPKMPALTMLSDNSFLVAGDNVKDYDFTFDPPSDFEFVSRENDDKQTLLKLKHDLNADENGLVSIRVQLKKDPSKEARHVFKKNPDAISSEPKLNAEDVLDSFEKPEIAPSDEDGNQNDAPLAINDLPQIEDLADFAKREAQPPEVIEAPPKPVEDEKELQPRNVVSLDKLLDKFEEIDRNAVAEKKMIGTEMEVQTEQLAPPTDELGEIYKFQEQIYPFTGEQTQRERFAGELNDHPVDAHLQNKSFGNQYNDWKMSEKREAEVMPDFRVNRRNEPIHNPQFYLGNEKADFHRSAPFAVHGALPEFVQEYRLDLGKPKYGLSRMKKNSITMTFCLMAFCLVWSFIL